MKNNKWEYKTIYKANHEIDLHGMQDFLNFRGKEGWELVHVISKPALDDPLSFSSHTFIFKRFKEESDTPFIEGRCEQLENGAKLTYHEWIECNYRKIDRDIYKQRGDHRGLVLYIERELRGQWAALPRKNSKNPNK